MEIGAIILAAGASRRLGRPKQLVTYRGETLLGRAVRMAREAGAQPVVVVLGAEYEAIAAVVNLSGVRVARNAEWAQGIASSIHAGLWVIEEIAPDVGGVLILTCDQPRLTVEHLQSLFAAFSEGKIAASAYAGGLGVPAIFSRGMFAELYALCGDKGARALLRETSRLAVVDFSGGEVDVDIPEDLAALE